jgi:pectate lyase
MSYLDILNEREGWGKDATGGAAGQLITVTDGAALAAALTSPTPLWITFPQGAVADIVMPNVVKWGSNKTLDCRGADINIRTANHDKRLFDWIGNSNVIMINARLEDGYANWKVDSEGSDGVHIENCSNFWIHHCTFSQWRDGSIDMKRGVKNGSVTWSRFSKGAQCLLWMGIGVTLAHCRATQIMKRFPKSVGGKVHAYNNLIESWNAAEIECARDNGQLLSEYSVFSPSGFNKVGHIVAGGKIASKNHRQVKSCSFLNSGAIDSTFASASRANAKMIKPRSDSEWKAMQNDLMTKAGATRMAAIV